MRLPGSISRHLCFYTTCFYINCSVQKITLCLFMIEIVLQIDLDITHYTPVWFKVPGEPMSSTNMAVICYPFWITLWERGSECRLIHGWFRFYFGCIWWLKPTFRICKNSRHVILIHRYHIILLPLGCFRLSNIQRVIGLTNKVKRPIWGHPCTVYTGKMDSLNIKMIVMSSHVRFIPGNHIYYGYHGSITYMVIQIRKKTLSEISNATC